MPSVRLGEVDSPSWASNFSLPLARCAKDRAIRLPAKLQKRILRLAQYKQYLRAASPKGNLQLKFFEPCNGALILLL